MSISSFIAKTGENPKFVAFMAHSWFAFGAMSILHRLGVPVVPLAVLFACVAAIKEFWFDLRYEQTPPQTFGDSALDFVGYMAGVGLALLVW